MSYINTSWKDNPHKIIWFDNGAYEIKHATAGSKKIKKYQNCKFFEKTNSNTLMSASAPFYIQDIKKDIPLESLSNLGKNYIRPLSRGLLSDIDIQLDIWEKIFQTQYNMEVGDETFNENLFIFTHTPMAPDEVIEGFFEIIFEYFGFNACFKAIPHVFASWYAKEYNQVKMNQTVQLVIDSGFSSTTIVPIFDDMPIYNAIRRVEIGGKLLTNYLKECLMNTIELDIRKEFYLCNWIKEEACFMSKNFINDMNISKNTDLTNLHFILPEYRGKSEALLDKIYPEKYMIKWNNLRYNVPELWYNPNMIGIEEGGWTEGIMQSVNECHTDYKNLLYENIITYGGNTKLPGFSERLWNELNSIVDHDYVSIVRVFDTKGLNKKQNENTNTIHETCEPVIEGMKWFAKNIDLLKDVAITKKEYDEMGFNIVWKTCY